MSDDDLYKLIFIFVIIGFIIYLILKYWYVVVILIGSGIAIYAGVNLNKKNKEKKEIENNQREEYNKSLGRELSKSLVSVSVPTIDYQKSEEPISIDDLIELFFYDIKKTVDFAQIDEYRLKIYQEFQKLNSIAYRKSGYSYSYSQLIDTEPPHWINDSNCVRIIKETLSFFKNNIEYLKNGKSNYDYYDLQKFEVMSNYLDNLRVYSEYLGSSK